MKKYNFLIFIGLYLYLSPVNAQSVCVPSDFCSSKLTALEEQLDLNCFSKYNESLDQLEMSDETLTFFDCMDRQSRNWSVGFGKECGGKVAQDLCFNKCKTYSGTIISHCLSTCSEF